MSSLLTIDLATHKGKLDEIAKDLHQLTYDVQHQGMIETMGSLRNRIHEPFLFVIVGEVKVGKSSFINALLESKTEICKVAPSPMTDTIQQIVYGEEHRESALSPVLKRITYPEEILKEIAIVDTPGTNTIIAHHQEITEKFVPTADLIVFVFEAKNPYRQSAWDLFQYIKEEWRKKIIFILQQKDLMPAEDLDVNISGLNHFAKEKGIESPLIFPVSAKMELDKDYERSGFFPLRAYIRDNITGGKAPILKLLNNIDTCETINTKLLSAINLRKEQYSADILFRKDIQQTLNDQERISKNNIQLLIENLLAAYDQSTNFKKEELTKGLGFLPVLKRGIGGLFNKEQSLQKWLQDFSTGFEKTLNDALKDKLHSGVKDISDSIQQMGQIVALKIRNSQTILKNDHEIFSDIADKRAGVLQDLHDAFQEFLKNTENYYSKELLNENSKMAPNVATGTGIAIVGAIITALTHGMVFDITGGVLTTIGLLFAGISLGFNKRKIIKQFESEIAQGRQKLHDQILQTLNKYVDDIKSKIDKNFIKLDEHLSKEKEQINNLENKYSSIIARLDDLRNAVST